MDAGQWFLTFFKDFVGTPAILVGIFAMLGAILLRKKLTEVITAFFKTAAGFFIIGGGAGVLVGSLSNFQLLFEDLFKITGSIPNNEALAGTVLQIAGPIAQLGSIVMVLSIVLNIALAWGSRFKFVYLSGHVLFYMSIALASVMILAGFDVNQPGDYAIALISSALIMSLYMVLSCAMLFKWTRLITKSNEISVAHSGALSYAMGGLIGDLIYKIKRGQNIRSTEAIKFPKGLQFFRNTFISMAITMIIVFLIVYIPEGIMYNTGIKVIDPSLPPEKVDGLASLFGAKASVNWLVTAVVEGFTFAAGVEIILLGVRMVIGELVPSFKGISEKVIKDAKAGVDCPIVFPYAPNAVLIGFLCSLIGAGVGLGISIGISAATRGSINVIPVIIPGIVAQFFLGATTGVFANARGGLLGTIIAAFLNGIIITLSPIVFYAAKWVPEGDNGVPVSSIWGDTDYLIAVLPGLLVLPKDPVVARVLVLLVPSLIWIALVVDGQIQRFKNRPSQPAQPTEAPDQLATGSAKPEAPTVKNQAIPAAAADSAQIMLSGAAGRA